MMRKLLFAISLLFMCSSTLRAVTLDDFQGRIDVSCPAPVHRVATTCSQSGTTVTCTVPNGAIFGFDEPIMVQGTGTAMDFVFNGVLTGGGTDLITTPVSGNTLVMTSPISATVGATSGTLQPARFYTATITTPFGTGPQLCTPEGHWYWPELVSNATRSLVNGHSAGSFQYFESSTLVSRTANVVTFTVATSNGGAPTNNGHVTVGMPVTVSLCADATFNGNFQPSSLGTRSFTYTAAGSDGTTTGCYVTGNGWAPPASPAKYTSECQMAMESLVQWSAMGFNGIGEDSDTVFIPFGGCTPVTSWLPFFTPVATPSFSRYPADNLFGCAPQPVHTPTWTLDRTITGHSVGIELVDWFDQNYLIHNQCDWNPNGGQSGTVYSRSPFDIGQTVDDSDGMAPFRGYGLWHSVPVGKNTAYPGLMVAFIAPQISLSNRLIYGSNLPAMFPVDTVWAKNLSAVAPASCSDAAPCSWPDWVRNKYTAVAAMNTAWGSTYTTFGSSQSAFTNETVTTPASYTFAHTNVTPRSVHVFLTPSGGSAFMVTGDCANGANDCSAGTAGAAQFIAPHVFLTNNLYALHTAVLDSNGDIEEVTSQTATPGKSGSVAPTWPTAAACTGTQTTVSNQDTFTCRGPEITGTMTYSTGVSAFTIGGAGTLPTGETLSVSYTTGGWDASTPGTGLEDEDGRSSWVTTNGVCPASIPAWASGTVYTAYDDSSVIAVTVGGINTWQMPIVTHTSGGAPPTFSSTQGVLSSDGNWESMGYAVSQVASPHDFTVACGANSLGGTGSPQWAADTLAWTEQLLAQYVGTNNTISKQFWPDLLDFGPNFSGNDWGNPTWRSGLKVLDNTIDVAFWGEIGNGSQTLDPEVKLKQAYETNYYHGPIVLENFESTSTANWESFTLCSSGFFLDCWPDLVARGQGWYSQINDMLTFKSPSGVSPYTGITWWRNACGDAVNQSTGCNNFIDEMNNRLNGVEDVSATVACSAPLAAFSCGGELPTIPWLGVNAEVNSGTTPCVHCLVDGNNLWLGGAAPPTFLIAPSKKSIIWGLASQGTEDKDAPSGAIRR